VDIHLSRISIVKCPCMDIPPYLDINEDIHMDIVMYGVLRTEIQKSWISISITADFWKSMYGYAMDSCTRVVKHTMVRFGTLS